MVQHVDMQHSAESGLRCPVSAERGKGGLEQLHVVKGAANACDVLKQTVATRLSVQACVMMSGVIAY